MTNFRNRIVATLPALMIAFAGTQATAQTPSNVFQSDGVQIHYVDNGGDGAPVVLLHSFAATSEHWQLNGIFGADGFRTIAIDLRGHGLSSKPTDPSAYGTTMADDVLNLLDTLEIEAAHFVGYSMGAEIALKFTVDHPERVLSLAVGGSGWSGAPEAEFYQFIGMSLGANASFAEWVRGMQPEMTDEEFGYLVAALEMHGISEEGQSTQALAAAAAGMPGLIDLTEDEIAAIAVPVLGIAGEFDMERPNIEAIEGVAPDFTMVVIEGADHLDAPMTETFRTTVLDFLAGQD